MDIRNPPIPQTPQELSWANFFKDAYNSCKCPNFKVTRTSNLAIAQNTETKVTFDTPIFNNLSGWDSTNHRFLPKIPGYYFVTFQAIFDFTSDAVNGNRLYAVIYGSRVNTYLAAAYYTLPPGTTNSTYLPTLYTSALVFLNGIDDYVDFKVYQNERTSANLRCDSGGHLSFAQGFKISY